MPDLHHLDDEALDTAYVEQVRHLFDVAIKNIAGGQAEADAIAHLTAGIDIARHLRASLRKSMDLEAP